MKYFFLFLLTGLTALQAQNITGIATYQSKTNIDFKMENKKLDPVMMAMIQEKMKKSFEKTYTLSFNQYESVFKEEEQLETPGQSSGNIQIKVSGYNSGKIYKNVDKALYKKETDISGKAFLIDDKLIPYEWELTDESKQIGQYVAFKAVATIKFDSLSSLKLRKPKLKKKNNTKDSDSIVSPLDELDLPKEKKITAWYTPQIPIQTGPDEYWGLPGLILEVQSGKTVILCSKIVLNPKDGFQIKIPKKGKPISKKEYAEIMIEKAKESKEMYSGKGKKSDMKIIYSN